MKKEKPFIIGVAGISGSGKTTISKKLAEKINANIIHLDDYWKYHSATELPPKEEWENWEHPNATDFNKALKNIEKLKNGGYLIIEGTHSFSNLKLRKLIDFKIYYSIPNYLVINRRTKKFGEDNNQKAYSKKAVIKAYKRYGKPMKKYADLILKGNGDINENLRIILKQIKK